MHPIMWCSLSTEGNTVRILTRVRIVLVAIAAALIVGTGAAGAMVAPSVGEGGGGSDTTYVPTPPPAKCPPVPNVPLGSPIYGCDPETGEYGWFK